MKITKIETFTNEFVSFVKITNDSGVEGWGQMSTYNADITSLIFHRQIAKWCIGKTLSSDKPDFSDLIQKITEHEHKFPGSYFLRALSGLDTALWDLYGKILELPVASLIGGSPKKIRAYGSSMRRDISPLEEAKRLCDLRDRYGFDAFKFRVGSECGRDKDEWPGRSEEIVKTVTKALGKNVSKLVDANSCFSPIKAIEFGKLLEDFDVSHFEEPCPYWEHEQTKEVKENLKIDVTGGEQDCDIALWKSIIKSKIVDIIQPDVMYMGGINRTLKVAKIAEEYGIPCTPHAANLSLVTVCTMHFLTAIPNSGKYLELSIEDESYYPWQKDLFLNDPFKVDSGKVEVKNIPGWGVEINPKWLENSQYKVTSI